MATSYMYLNGYNPRQTKINNAGTSLIYIHIYIYIREVNIK